MAAKKPLVIFGISELADLAFFYFSRFSNHEVKAFCLDAAHIKSGTLHGLPVVPFETVEKDFPPASCDMFVAIGYSHVNRNRAKKYHEAKQKGYRLATCISPHAVVHTDRIGENCLILDGNSLHPYVTIGNNVIFSNDNHIGHHATIEDHCFVTGNVIVSGGTVVGEGTFLGLNALLTNNIRIGRYNVIGAGALIMKDTADNEVFRVEGTKPTGQNSIDSLKS